MKTGDCFFRIQGRKAYEEHGNEMEIEQIGYGRSANELWIKSKGAKVGKNVFLSSFKPLSEECKGLKCSSVNELVSSLKHKFEWLIVHNRKRKTPCNTPKEKEKKQKITIGDEEVSASYEERELPDILFLDKFIGKFDVNVLTLNEPPKEYMTRDINQDWVTTLKNRIKEQPTRVPTIFPVMVSHHQVKERHQFVDSRISCYNLWTLGGNHIRCALQQLAKETQLHELRIVHIHLYYGLSGDEMVRLGNVHNGAQSVLKPTFQDYVTQTRKHYVEQGDTKLSEVVVQMVKDIEVKNVTKDSSLVGAVVSVSKYSQTNFELVNKIFFKHEHQFGKDKSIPQNLFKELQGVSADKDKTAFLQEALSWSLDHVTKKVKTAKKKAKLMKVFQKVVDVDDEETCKRMYQDHVNGIDKYLDLELKNNTVPEVFIDYCQDALHDRPLPESSNIEIKITYKLT